MLFGAGACPVFADADGLVVGVAFVFIQELVHLRGAAEIPAGIRIPGNQIGYRTQTRPFAAGVIRSGCCEASRVFLFCKGIQLGY